MDLQLYFRVLWRFRVLVVAGLVLGAALALLSFVRVDLSDGKPVFTYRESEQWVSYSTLWITPESFPWGSSTIEPVLTDVGPRAQASKLGVQVAPPEWFSSLAILYAQLAMSDPVAEIMAKGGPVNGSIEAAPVLSDRDALPFVRIAAISDSPAEAVSLARREVDAFQRYLVEQQHTTGIPQKERVIAKVNQQAQFAELYADRSKTRPIMVFLTVLVVVVGLAFILENLRPRIHPEPATRTPDVQDEIRRSA